VVHRAAPFESGKWRLLEREDLSGLLLFFLVFVRGWTGYVMLWDAQALVLAVEGARLMDALPIFSEPIVRTFTGERPIPSAFFFLNLFLHIAIPVGMALLLWIHVSRVARPVLLPPRRLLQALLLLLLAASLLAPAPLGPPARLDELALSVDLDVFYAFWLPVSRRLAPGEAWLALGASSAVLLLAPLWTRPARRERPGPSVGNEHLCTGCDQCTLDCPYEAIAMLAREERPDERFARVTPELCVSCGICAGSCAPMAIGPPGRTGRDELAQLRAFTAAHPLLVGDVVVAACRCAAGRRANAEELAGAALVAFSCAGGIHTSAVELLLRAGASGVLVWSCPPRDCAYREGPRWLEERLHHGREAELRESVDRRRIRVAYAGAGEARDVLRELSAFRADLARLARPLPRAPDEAEPECERLEAAT
jgi:ferredoxin/coenzyme F420-reducing hydrogenase delta subunit